MPERIKVAMRSQLQPGQMHYVMVDGLPVALANVAGAIYGFSDTCRHQGGPLSSGVLRDDVVTCPWHGWAYSVRTGKAVVPPIGVRIPTYQVEIDGDDVFVLIAWEEQ